MISIDQQKIVDLISQNYNVVVNAVAGSGKTTTIKYICELINKHILVLTYNSFLKKETRQKLSNYDNVEVHSFHSFGYKYIDRESFTTDLGMEKFLNATLPDNIKKEFDFDSVAEGGAESEVNSGADTEGRANTEGNEYYLEDTSNIFDIVIIDEAQDLRRLYYLFIKEAVLRYNPNAQIIILGDRKQSIYEYNGADSRYLLYPHIMFKNKYEWRVGNLRTTFRLTSNMCYFLNEIMQLNKENSFDIVSSKTDTEGKINEKSVEYVILAKNEEKTFTNVINSNIIHSIGKGQEFFDKLYECIKIFDYKDIMIVFPSIKSLNDQSPIFRIIRNITSLGIFTHNIKDEEEDFRNENIIKNKILVTNFHKTKGIERKCVLVYGFDDSYNIYYDRSSIKNKCSNILYVIASRAKEKIIFFHNSHNDYLGFIDQIKLRNNRTLFTNISINPKNKENNCRKQSKIGITSIYNKLSNKIINKIINNCLITKIVNNENDTKKIELDAFKSNRVGGKKLTNLVNNITGSAIPILYRYKILKENVYRSMISEIITTYSKDIGEHINKNINIIGEALENFPRKDSINNYHSYITENFNVEYCLKLTNIWMASKYELNFNNILQIKEFTWLNERDSNKLIKRLHCALKCNNVVKESYEHGILLNLTDKIKLIGFIDYINNHAIYEIKCVKKITKQHIIQLILYYAVWKQLNRESYRKLILVDLLSNVNYQITFNMEREKINRFLKSILNDVIPFLSDDKKTRKLTDKEFVALAYNI